MSKAKFTQDKTTSSGEDSDYHLSCHHRPHAFWRIFWGLTFVVAACAVIANATGFLSFYGVNIGLILLSIVLFAIIISSLFQLNWFGVFPPIALCVTIANYQTDLINVESNVIGAIWGTAFLLAIGFSILFHGRWRWYHFAHRRHTSTAHSTADEVIIETSFGESIKHIDTKDFKYARLSSDFGSIKAHFDKAVIQGDSATIEIDSSFSGLELHIPQEWTIIDHLSKSFAGVSEKNARNRYDKKDEKTVQLIGELDFSGLDIFYV